MDGAKRSRRKCFGVQLICNPVSLKRWCDVIILTVFAITICLVIIPPLIVFFKRMFQHLQGINWILLLIMQLILSGVALIFLYRIGGYPCLTNSKLSYRYPPLRAFALIGAIVFLIGYYYVIEHQTSPTLLESAFFLWFLGGILIIAFISFIACEIIKIYKNKSKKDNNNGFDNAPNNQNHLSLIDWINEEKPIDFICDDKFEHEVYARRIASILKDQTLKTIALVGANGCGKSSIVRMVNDYLCRQGKLDHIDSHLNYEKIVSCEVSGWGFHDGSATDHILEKAICALSQYIDCLGIVKLPSHYRNALSDTDSSWFKIFSNLSNQYHDPLEVLQKLDDILDCVKIRLVIFLEDIDRNPKTDANTKDSFFSEVAALLDRLNILKNVSFVLTFTEERDLMRIAEHMEVVSAVPQHLVIECIREFRDYWLGRYGDVDSLTHEERNIRLGVLNSNISSDLLSLKSTNNFLTNNLARQLSNKNIRIINCIARQLNNPRRLKAVLRRTQQTWQQSLHGEIDFDDLLVANVIRFVAPETFLYINNDKSKFSKLGFHNSNNLKFKERPLYINLDNTIRNETQKEDVHILVNFLFPGWNEGIFDEAKIVPQGVAQTKGNDYWSRLNREEINPSETHDQDILIAIENWKTNKDEASFKGLTIPKAIFAHDGFIERIVQFDRIITLSELLDLTSEVSAISLSINTNTASGGNTKGFHELFSSISKKYVSAFEAKNIENNFQDWMLKEIEKSIQISLGFTLDLIAEAHMFMFRTDDYFNNIMTFSKNTFNKNPDKLIKVIDPQKIKTIGSFIHTLSGLKKTFEFEDWEWFADLLIEAAKLNKGIIVPQIAGLISLNQTEQSLFTDVLTSVFGKNISKVMKLLTEEVDTDKLTQESKELVIRANLIAKKWLYDNKMLIINN